jgi:hypothetical protein
MLEGGAQIATVAHNNITGNLLDGVSIGGVNTSFNVVCANRIGQIISPSGKVYRNGHHGVDIYDNASQNTIGDATDGSLGNTITGCGWSAIAIANGNSNLVANNRTFDYWNDSQGSGYTVGNAFHGVHIYNGSSNTIGPQNQIMYNGLYNNVDNHGFGVYVNGPGAQGNRITRNAIAFNTAKGIKLENSANGGLLPPVIGANCTSVGGDPCPTCPVPCPWCSGVVEIYSDYWDQGLQYEGSVVSVTPYQHYFGFILSFGRVHVPNVTATYTDFAGNTSEFSAAINLGNCRSIFLPVISR